MSEQDRSTPDDPAAPATLGQFATGDRVTRHGTVSFVRSGFAQVRWDDDLDAPADEWCTDLTAERGEHG
jgi:hypothetical protein